MSSTCHPATTSIILLTEFLEIFVLNYKTYLYRVVVDPASIWEAESRTPQLYYVEPFNRYVAFSLLPPPRRLWFRRCFDLFVCLSVRFLATMRKKFRTDLHAIFREGSQWVSEQMIKFCWRSGSRIRIRIRIRLRRAWRRYALSSASSSEYDYRPLCEPVKANCRVCVCVGVFG